MKRCLDCQQELTFADFYSANKDRYSKAQLQQWWDSPHIALLCCACYRKRELRSIQEVVLYLKFMNKNSYETEMWDYMKNKAKETKVGISQILYSMHKLLRTISVQQNKKILELTKKDVLEYFNTGLVLEKVLDTLGARIRD